MKRILLILFFFAMESLHANPEWIWKSGRIKTEKAEFRHTFNLKKLPKKALLRVSCDNQFTLLINNKKVASSSNWQVPINKDLAASLKKGQNTILVQAENEGSIAGLVFELKVHGGPTVESNANWQARAPKGKWHAAVKVKAYGAAPWGNVLDKVAQKTPHVAKRIDTKISTLPGFKAEKIYDIPKKEQGSWVGLTSDDKGRLIACDQYGGIYRVNLGNKLSVEKLKVKVTGAHGVLYAFNSLYVFSYTGGLFRLQDSNGDDQFDKEELLMGGFKAKGEHGIHSMVLSPDKKSIYLVTGNNADLPKSVTKLRMARAWKEDHLLPRMDDGRGHNRGRLAPGGLIIKISPDAKKQELISHGYRNPFDAAFNNHGELFTYDADMEYDIGSPWYRPTRINHVVSGSDFGWRHGTGKWPDYYTDTLPTTLDIGPGSPTGVTNGLGAKFPAKYQNAIFINDWTYGTMYAVHLEANGASYKAMHEEFVSGKPLPLTDVVIHSDGNMYFLVGGRRTTSALYRLSYIGKESTAPVKLPTRPVAISQRLELEKLHIDGVGEEAISKAWPFLGHEDRYLRHAARIAIEKQDPLKWQTKLYAETRPWAVIEASVALARLGAQNTQTQVLSNLNKKINLKTASKAQFLGAIRAYQLAFTRMGKPSSADAQAVIAKLNPLFPSKDNSINRELCQVLLYLNAPNAVSKTVREMLSATEQQVKLLSDEILNRNDRYKAATKKMEQFRPNIQQFSLAFSLRSIKDGWTEADRASYFSWFPRAQTWQGGNSFSIFIKNTLKEALANVKDGTLKAKYTEISSKSLKKSRAVIAPKGPGQLWTVSSATKAVKNNLTRRNFKSGENLYHAAACATCHRFAGQGSGIGPDLTGSANRYSLKDMMENIIEPSKVISDQYGSTLFTMKDGSQIIGRMGTEENGIMHVMTNPFSPESNVDIKLADVKEKKEWHISPMPPALVNSLNADELSDLIAYIFSAGNENHKYFTSESNGSELKGAKQLFNGKNLQGWKGNPKLWKVENGVIIGNTHGNKISKNSFLVWEGEVEDFYLIYEAKSVGVNSGMMYRAFWNDEKIFRLSGYQADMHPKAEYMAMLYGEGLPGRGIIAKRGQRVEVGSNGKAKVVGKTSAVTPVNLGEWQTYEVICKGNHMIHKLNGKITVDIIDNHPKKLLKGMIGMQLHVGGPMKCWFRNIRLKKY